MKRLKMWGVKDGKRVLIDQRGPRLDLDPEIPILRESDDIEKAASQYLDTIIDVWRGSWSSDRQVEERAPARSAECPNYDGEGQHVAHLRSIEEDKFVRDNSGPPWNWEKIEECLAHQSKWLRPGRQGNWVNQPPSEVLLCRDCLQPSEWIWHECFPGPNCGSAGWVAICRPCRTWHRERTCLIS